MVDRRYYTRFMLVTMFVCFFVTTFMVIRWVTGFPTNADPVIYAAAIGVPSAFNLGLARECRLMYEKYMENGVKLATGQPQPEYKIEGKAVPA